MNQLVLEIRDENMYEMTSILAALCSGGMLHSFSPIKEINNVELMGVSITKKKYDKLFPNNKHNL